MPSTISFATGDGLANPQIFAQVAEPDSGSSIAIGGNVNFQGVSVSITGGPITAPSPPGSGSIYFIIQVNESTGLATMKQSTSAMPAADAGNVTVYSNILVPASTDIALDASAAEPSY